LRSERRIRVKPTVCAFSQQIRFGAAGRQDVGGEYAVYMVYMMDKAARPPATPAFDFIWRVFLARTGIRCARKRDESAPKP
jgi:hypothetical protein